MSIKKLGPGPAKSSEDIARKTQEYLAKGGEIQQIRQGATGIPDKPKKGMQIHIKNKR